MHLFKCLKNNRAAEMNCTFEMTETHKFRVVITELDKVIYISIALCVGNL